MKNTYIIFLLALAGWATTACEENPDYFDVEKAPSIITFEGFPGFSGTFATTGDIVIPVTATNASEIVVERIVNYDTKIGDTDTTLTLTEVLTTLNGPEATLNTTWDAVIANPQNEELGSVNSVQLDFNVTVDGEMTFKTFDLEFVDPIALGFTKRVNGENVNFQNPATALRDSTFTIYYEINSSETLIEKVELFTKVNKSGTFSTTPAQTVTLDDTQLDTAEATFTFPSEDMIATDSIYAIMITATAANGNTTSKVVEVKAAEVPFSQEGTFTLRPAAYELKAGVTDTLNQAFDFSQLKKLSSAIIADSPDSVDLILMADTVAESLSLEAMNDTELVVAEDDFSFAGATYEASRDAFADGTPVTVVEDLSSLPSGQVVIVRIGDVADDNSARYAVMQIASLDRGFDIEQSEVEITYRAR